MNNLMKLAVTLFAAAILSSAKAIVDVQVLKANYINIKEDVALIQTDIREMRNHLMGEEL